MHYLPVVVAPPNAVAGFAPKSPPPPPNAFVLVDGCDACPKGPPPAEGPAEFVVPKAPAAGVPNVFVAPVLPNVPKPVVGLGWPNRPPVFAVLFAAPPNAPSQTIENDMVKRAKCRHTKPSRRGRS